MGKVERLSFKDLLEKTNAKEEEFWGEYEEAKKMIPPNFHIDKLSSYSYNEYIPIKKLGRWRDYVCLYEIPWNKDAVLVIAMSWFLGKKLSKIYPPDKYDCTGGYSGPHWKAIDEFSFLDLDIITVELPQRLLSV
ncbi:MAG: hypothetical protein WC459_03945 [Patescibacteria group bacterium]